MSGVAAIARLHVLNASPGLFACGTLFIGFGAGLFGHGTLTATMNLAPAGQAGLALGAWGAVQATAAGVAIALGGVLRDLFAGIAAPDLLGAAMAYDLVYAIEILLLLATIGAMLPLMRPAGARARADRLLATSGREVRPQPESSSHAAHSDL